MARDTPIRDVMTFDVITLRPNMPLEEAVSALAERGVSGAPVLDDTGALVGMLDDSDLLTSTSRLHAPTTIELLGAYITLPGEQRRYTEEIRHALARTVGEIMAKDFPTVREDGTVEDAATAIVDHHVSRVPVVDRDGRLVGIATRGDLVASMRMVVDGD
jgi:CBS domain-containing protein